MTTSSTEGPRVRAGFIGLGAQGTPMARRIAGAGFPTTVWARRAAVAEAAAQWGARTVATPAEVGAASDVVGVCVFDAAGVRDVLFGADGVVRGMAPGGIVTVHSTVSPAEIVEIAAAAEQHGIVVVDAPVSGGPDAAAAGELLTLLAGPQDAVDRVAPLVGSYAGRMVRFGRVGTAQLAKLFNNALLAAQVALVVDALEVGRAQGLDEGLLAVFGAGSARGLAVDLIAGFGSLEVLGTATQFGPTIAKDVGLLRASITGTGAGSPMLSLATDLAGRLPVDTGPGAA